MTLNCYESRDMTRKLIVTAFSAILFAGLAGCALPLDVPSQPGPAEPSTPPESTLPSDFTDKLIGVYMTTEPLALGPDERMYATETPGTGYASGVPQYMFTTLDGFYMFEVHLENPSTDSNQYEGSILDPAQEDTTSTDASTGIATTTRAVTGTIQVASSDDGSIYTLFGNPIYQTVDDKVYLIKGTADQTLAFLRDTQQVSQAPDTTLTLSQTTTLTTNGQTTIYDSTVAFTVRLIKAPAKIVVLDMGANNRPLSRTAYAPGTLPSSLTPHTGTAYIILETTSVDSSVDRRILSPDDTVFVTYAARSDGICIGYPTHLNWP